MRNPTLLGEILGTVYLLLPLLGGAALHGICMRHDWLSFLARPMDRGRLVRGRPLFGRSKTWRGPVLLAAGSAAVFALQRGPLHQLESVAWLELVDYGQLPGWLGAVAGGVGELFELPNSFTKRQLDIPPGGTAKGAAGVWFYLWDQLDVLLGYWLVLAFFVSPTPLRLAASVAVVGSVHPLLTAIGYQLGMRPTAR